MNIVAPFPNSTTVLLLGLVLASASMNVRADLIVEWRSDAPLQAERIPVLSETERFEWIERARADLAAETDGIGTDADRQHRAFLRAFAEPDRAQQEALLHVCLSEYVGPAPAGEPNTARLQRLLGFEPVVLVEHHDHPEHVRPAFNIAGRARNRITEQQIRLRSRELADQPGSIPAALLSHEEPVEFRAGLLALEALEPAARSALFADPYRSFLKRPSGAEATLALVDRGWIAADALLPLIEHAEPSIALRAFRQSRERDDGVRRLALDRALARPGLGGLPVADAARDADPKRRATVWALLADPERGADAALALARHADDLVDRIDAGFDEAAPRARLRMLLALRLRDTPSSLALLQELRAERLSPAERRATEAWQ